MTRSRSCRFTAFSLLAFLSARASCPLALASGPRYAAHQVLVRFKQAPNISSRGLSAQAFGQMPVGATAALTSVHAQFVQPLYSPRSVSPLVPSAKAFLFSAAEEPLRRTVVATLDNAVRVEDAVKILSADPNVDMCEPNYLLDAIRSPDDTSYGLQWGLKNSGQSGSIDSFDPATGTAGDDIAVERAWDTQTGSKDVIVAVIDTGTDWAHPDLSANIWSNPHETENGLDDDGDGLVDDTRGWDFGDGDKNPTDDCSDDSVRGHGTHVSGIIGAAGNNSAGVSGVNWAVSLMPLKVAASNCDIPISAVVSALTYAAAHGARVANMSLGGPDSDTLKSAVAAADAAGVVLVAAAGNSDTTALSYPAAYANVVAVAATDRKDQRASFSNYGTWVALSAPGVGIQSTLPTADGSYGYKSGTSMASPMVAGVAALVVAQYPALTNSEIRARLTSSCENIDAGNSGFAGLLGAGRVNAARALLGVTGISPVTGVLNHIASVTISGAGFSSGLTIQLTKAGETAITASHITVNSGTSIDCQFDLTGAALGTWDVTLSTGQTTQKLTAAFLIETSVVSSISPTQLSSNGPASSVALSGRNFETGMTARLRRAGQSDVVGSTVTVISDTSATVTFDPTGLLGGRWDVVLFLGSASSTLAKGLAVTSPVFNVVTTDPSQDMTYMLQPAAGTEQVRWPAGASAAISLDLDAAPALPAVNGALDPYVATGIGIEITPSVATPLAKPFRLTLPYRLSDLPDPAKESALTLATYNTVTGRWEPIESQLDSGARTVAADVAHLSTFAIVQHVASMGLKSMIAFPNPFRTDRGHDRIVFDFLPAGSRVRIYTIAGELVRDLNDDNGDGQIIWPVTTSAGQPVASGIYLYLVTDPSGGKKTGRLGIVR